MSLSQRILLALDGAAEKTATTIALDLGLPLDDVWGALLEFEKQGGVGRSFHPIKWYRKDIITEDKSKPTTFEEEMK